ncbi:glycosyltransferase family 58 protein [Irpex rosettiformis]|uniref:Glycosyltransferase family 58 protein n=1 Tax=Irpex rosettiformis TaxID=378272 RepID=A0ACB8UGJ8_9APHY|nr:glycosyltransferase family 58 protein [Irpex rosettiformis]
MSTPSPPRPPSILSIRSFHDLFQYAIALLTDPCHFVSLGFLVLVGDALLTWVIISFVTYTEIDWETYMYQLELYMKGERDYALISGPTGPLVYPAGHVYVHRLLYSLTNAGTNVKVAQIIFGSLYLVSLTLTIAIYRQAHSIPNWVLLLLPLSKRLHSIYVLRLFNDCWSVVAAQAAIFALAGGRETFGMLLFSAAVSVKMSALLYLPGILVVLFKRSGAVVTALHTFLFILTQAAIGSEFLLTYPRSYLKYSYELGRVFLYKWTVNWRFISEETFLSSTWARGLLIGQLTTLIAFAAFRWCRRDGGAFTVVMRGLRTPSSAPGLTVVTPDYVTTVLFTSNLIGILFARSLHYQFYSWYAHQLPFLAWRTKYPIPVKLLLLLGIEYSWNVFPSTPISSGVLLLSNVALLTGVWFGYPEGKDPGKADFNRD